MPASVYIVFCRCNGRWVAAYNPGHVTRAEVEALLRVEIGRRTGRPVGAVDFRTGGHK